MPYRVPRPAILEAAGRILDREVEEHSPEPVSAVAARACEQIYGHLTKFLGEYGVRALFDRSLLLVASAHPWLACAAAAKAESPWPPLRACLQEHEASAREGSIALIATFISLCVTLFGEGIALRFLSQLWPGVFDPGAKEAK